MELYAVQLHIGIFDCTARTVIRFCDNLESLGGLRYIIRMTHKHVLRRFQSLEKDGGSFKFRLSRTVLADVARRNLAAEHIAHKLEAVADSENGDPRFKKPGFAFRRLLAVNAQGSSRRDNSYGIKFKQFFQRSISRSYNGINTAFSDSSGNKLFILPTEIEYKYRLIFHFERPH